MYLKEIKAQGFKSFANLTRIEFSKGLTGIVGPNGSGKSNVVDAIRWVLGEQSIKSLRGDYVMTDVIFSGSKTKNPANIATVTLIFDNSQSNKYSEYSEIEIQRKLYRDGTNEYYLHQKQCRLKDITDFLMESGLAKEGLNIISQGKIDEIISSKPADRKVVFEEAAGVLKYKKKKEETFRKLEKTNDNINRINDIIFEIEDRLKPLTREKNKAEKYLKYSEQLRNQEIALLAKDIKDINQTYEEKKEKLKTHQDELVVLNSNVQLSENQSQTEKSTNDQINQELAKAQKKLLEQTALVEKINSEKKLLIEQKKYQVADQKLHNNLLILKENQLSLENKQAKIKQEQESLKTKTETIEKTIININQEINELSEKRNKIQIELANFLRNEQVLKAKIARNKESIDHNSFMPAAVSKVLANPQLKNHGTIGQVIEVADEYNTAISTALGNLANNVIVDHEYDAKQAINYLKNNNLGRVTFQPLNIIKGKEINNEIIEIVRNQTGFIDVAAKLVRYEEKYQAIITSILGTVLVVDQIENANNIAKRLNYRHKIVTLDGELINYGGAVTGGKLFIQSTITEKLALENNLKELQKTNDKIEELESEINEIDDQYKQQEQILMQKKQEKFSFENKNNHLLESTQNYQEEITNIQEEINRINNKQTLDEAETDIMEKYYQVKQEKDNITHQINELQEKRDQIEEKLNQQDAEYRLKNKELHEKQTMIKELEIELNRYDVKLENLLSYLSNEYQMTFEYAQNNYHLDQEEEKVREEVDSLKEKLAKIGYVNQNAPKEWESVNQRYEFLTKQKEDLQVSASNLLTTIKELDETMEKEFKKVFNQINHNFSIVFKELFKGGEAKLELTDPNDFQKTAINIKAQPPGKKLTSINLLSGGEKSLTAICLLFAILKTKPISFCVFDEIEAALDENNVTIFGEYLKKLETKTQFIIITHKKKTMEYVDLLYGITMQEQGISKLVSVKLADLD